MWDNLKIKEVQERVLKTGVTNFNVDLVNPSREVLATYLGADVEKISEPNYDDKIVVRLSTDEGVKTKVTFWPSMDTVQTKDGTKKMYINHFGQTWWLADITDETPDWFKSKGLREARKGEADIMGFFVGWISPDLEEGSMDLPFEAFCNGDVTEIANAITHFSDRQVKGLLGVKDGKYQEVNNREFGPAGLKSLKRFERQIENWKGVTSTLEYRDYTAPSAPSENETDGDDLPF